MKNLNYSGLVVLLLLASVFIGCEKDMEPVEQIDNTLQQVTTWRMLMFSDAIQPTQLSYRDLDADGPDDPITISGGTAAANSVFRTQLELFDETMFPQLDVNAFIKNNSATYQVFYVGNGIDITVVADDEDVNGNPMGLLTDVTTGDPGVGSVTIILRSNPSKNSSNNPVSAGGQTIGEVTIPLTIE